MDGPATDINCHRVTTDVSCGAIKRRTYVKSPCLNDKIVK
jgi:hypothetical protein